MKIAMATFEIKRSINQNIETMIKLISNISSQKVDIIMFPEDCFTGLSNCDIPDKDIKLGKSINSDEIKKIKQAALENKTHIAFGFLELENNKLYDSYIIKVVSIGMIN